MDPILSGSLMAGSILCVVIVSLFIRFGCCFCCCSSCYCKKKEKYELVYD